MILFTRVTRGAALAISRTNVFTCSAGVPFSDPDLCDHMQFLQTLLRTEWSEEALTLMFVDIEDAILSYNTDGTLAVKDCCRFSILHVTHIKRDGWIDYCNSMRFQYDLLKFVDKGFAKYSLVVTRKKLAENNFYGCILKNEQSAGVMWMRRTCSPEDADIDIDALIDTYYESYVKYLYHNKGNYTKATVKPKEADAYAEVHYGIHELRVPSPIDPYDFKSPFSHLDDNILLCQKNEDDIVLHAIATGCDKPETAEILDREYKGRNWLWIPARNWERELYTELSTPSYSNMRCAVNFRNRVSRISAAEYARLRALPLTEVYADIKASLNVGELFDVEIFGKKFESIVVYVDEKPNAAFILGANVLNQFEITMYGGKIQKVVHRGVINDTE